MVKSKNINACISNIYNIKPFNCKVSNSFFVINNDYGLMKKRMYENIRRGLIKEAYEDAIVISNGVPNIEIKIITSRLLLCLGEIDKAINEIDVCLDCNQSYNKLLKITKLDIEFVRCLLNNGNDLDVLRQDYVLQSFLDSDEKYLWVDFMPFIISILNSNRAEANEWAYLIAKNNNNDKGKLAGELLSVMSGLLFTKKKYRGLKDFIEWAETKNGEKLINCRNNSEFPDGEYIFSNAILNSSLESF